MSILVDKTKPKEKVPRALRLNIPGLEEIIDAGLMQDQVKFTCKSISATSSSGGSMERNNLFLLLPYEEGEKGFVDTEALNHILEKGKCMAAQKGVKELPLVSIGATVRKCAEFVFRKSGIRIKICRPKHEVSIERNRGRRAEILGSKKIQTVKYSSAREGKVFPKY